MHSKPSPSPAAFAHLISYHSPSVDKHADHLMRWAFAPASTGIDRITGAMINFRGQVIKPSANIVSGGAAFMEALDALLKAKAGL